MDLGGGGGVGLCQAATTTALWSESSVPSFWPKNFAVSSPVPSNQFSLYATCLRTFLRRYARTAFARRFDRARL